MRTSDAIGLNRVYNVFARALFVEAEGDALEISNGSYNITVKDSILISNSLRALNAGAAGSNIRLENVTLSGNVIFPDDITLINVPGYSNNPIPTEQPPHPISGSMYIDPSTGTLYVYDGSSWKSVALS